MLAQFLGRRQDESLIMNRVFEKLSLVQKEIAPYNPKIVAVTKYFDENRLIEAYEAGIRDFGENRVTDAIEKINKLPKEIRTTSRFHLIGHLQTNKVKKAVGHFYLIHSVDSLKLAIAINGQAKQQGIIQKILLQVNNAKEEAKSGFDVEELEQDFAELITLQNIEVCGLMTMAPLATNDNELKTLFTEIKTLNQKLGEKYTIKMIEVSMGMSYDYKIAAECGATILRLGRILFS